MLLQVLIAPFPGGRAGVGWNGFCCCCSGPRLHDIPLLPSSGQSGCSSSSRSIDSFCPRIIALMASWRSVRMSAPLSHLPAAVLLAPHPLPSLPPIFLTTLAALTDLTGLLIADNLPVCLPWPCYTLASASAAGVVEEALALQEGLVLLRGWIGLEKQADIVRAIR